MRKFIFLVVILSVGACSPQKDSAFSGNSGTAESLLTPEERRTTRLSSRWLVGYWDHDRNCGTGAGTSLRRDGTYTMNDASGKWSLSGDVLTIKQERSPSVQIFQARIGDAGRSRVTILGPDAISLRWLGDDGDGTGNFYRCDPT